MATSRGIIEGLSRYSPWPKSDLRNRVRWLIQEGLLPRGKAGRGGAGAAQLEPVHIVCILLGLGVPEATAAPRFVDVLLNMKGINSDGNTISLSDLLVLKLLRVRNRKLQDADPFSIHRILLIFNDLWPAAEVHLVSNLDEGSQTLYFSRDVPRVVGGVMQIGGSWLFNRSLLIDGKLIHFLGNLMVIDGGDKEAGEDG